MDIGGHGSSQLQTLRTRGVSPKELLSRVGRIAGVWNCSARDAGNLSLRRAGAVPDGYRTRRPRIGADKASPQAVPPGSVSEVLIQTMGCFGDSAPQIISGSSFSFNTRYSY